MIPPHIPRSCAYLCKDTNLKAIHNTLVIAELSHLVVLTYAKIQIWKQFTTVLSSFVASALLCLPMQRYKFESNSQQAWHCDEWRAVVLTYAKIQIWKQFTTNDKSGTFVLPLCLPMQRYKFESNSQLQLNVNAARVGCAYLCKDTNLKAIHNLTVELASAMPVVLTYAKIQIWKQFTT